MENMNNIELENLQETVAPANQGDGALLGLIIGVIYLYEQE